MDVFDTAKKIAGDYIAKPIDEGVDAIAKHVAEGVHAVAKQVDRGIEKGGELAHDHVAQPINDIAEGIADIAKN